MLNQKEGLELLTREDILTLGKDANALRQKLHPGKTVTFIIGGVVKVYQWTKLKLTNFKDWVIGLFAKKQPA